MKVEKFHILGNFLRDRDRREIQNLREENSNKCVQDKAERIW